MPRLLLLVAALALGSAGLRAQSPPPAAPLPGAGALPSAPANTRLPGVDHRQCGPTKWSALCAAGRWTQFSRAQIKVRARDFDGRYDIEQAANGELHVTYAETIGKESRGGEIVLVGREGFAYRSREKFPDPDNIIDYALTNPILMSQLVALLLDLGVLEAPADVTAPRAIRAASATQYLRTAAPRKAVLYGAPWTMTGSVRRASPERIAFNVKLDFRPVDANGNAIGGKRDTVALEGDLSFAPLRPALPDSFDLVGWRLKRVGEAGELPAVSTLREARSAVP
jgi:hypothetical protein